MTFHLETTPEGACGLRFRRRFNAPRALVWRAFTEPGLLTQWLWTEDHRMTFCEQDFRPGGSFRWCWAMTGGGSMGLSGRYQRIEPETRIVHAELFDDDWTGGETTVTTSFHEDGDDTVIEMEVLYPSTEARDRAAASPMAAGLEQGYARLANLLPGWACAAALT